MNEILTVPTVETPTVDYPAIKARQKSTWESGDFGRVAETIEIVAEEFMARLPLRPGLRVLDVASGTGNLAMIAARIGCNTYGVDIAPGQNELLILAVTVGIDSMAHAGK